jgi:hypothetical protein
MSDIPRRHMDGGTALQVVLLSLSTILTTALIVYFAYRAHTLGEQVRAHQAEMRAIRTDVEQYQAKVAGYMWKRDRDWDPHIKAIPVEPK